MSGCQHLTVLICHCAAAVVKGMIYLLVSKQSRHHHHYQKNFEQINAGSPPATISYLDFFISINDFVFLNAVLVHSLCIGLSAACVWKVLFKWPCLSLTGGFISALFECTALSRLYQRLPLFTPLQFWFKWCHFSYLNGCKLSTNFQHKVTEVLNFVCDNTRFVA